MTTTVVRSEPLDRSARLSFAHIRSARGVLGALGLLLALPITIGYQILFPVGAEVVIHVALAVGTLLVGLSAFDFDTPSWLASVTCVAASALAIIFLGQGLAEFTQSEGLKNIAFSREIGAWGEMITVTMVMVWFIAVAVTHGRGPTMILGILSSALTVGLGVWSVLFAPPAGTPQEMRLLFLLPIAWFLFVSTRRTFTNRVMPPRLAH
jgi:hypothetical protein